MALRFSSLVLLICLTACSIARNRPPDKPASLAVQIPTEHSLTAYWSKPWARGINRPGMDETVQGYKLIYGDGTFESTEVTIPADQQRKYVIRGLQPSRTYIVGVSAFNEFGTGPPMYFYGTTKALEGQSSEPNKVVWPIESMYTSFVSSKSIYVYWRDLYKPDKPDGRVYTVRCRPDDPYASFSYKNTTKKSASFEGLTPNTTYEFSVRINVGEIRSFWMVPPYKTTTRKLRSP